MTESLKKHKTVGILSKESLEFPTRILLLLIIFSPGIGVIDPRMISVMSVRASVDFY